MNSIPQNVEKKPARSCDGSERTMNMNQIMTRELNAFYRESENPLSSDSGGSSGRNSVCNESEENLQPGDLFHENLSRDEIAEKLSKLKISSNKNLKNDSGTVDDLTTSEDDLKSHSIIAGRSPADIHHNTIQSLPDSRYSLILAGRLDSKDDLFANIDEQSLLNIAINESVSESDAGNRTNDAELSNFVDSLEVRKEQISSTDINERDSLESEDYYAGNKSGNKGKQHFLYNNNENVDPNILDTKKRGQPRIVSDEILKVPIKTFKQIGIKTPGKLESESRSFFDFISENLDRSDSTNDKYISLMSETERLAIADIKTPNCKRIKFIEDCYKSSPMIGINADTFGSELITDISNLTALGEEEGGFESDGKNAKTDNCRVQIFKRLSQQFAEAPTKFTEKLLSIVESSVLVHSKIDNPDNSGVSLNRLTEEFRKMCRDKRIEDESMPSHLFDVSSFPNFEGTTVLCEDPAAATSPFHNFSKLGGGKKVYRKTPRRVLNSNNVTNCGSPNCANASHRAKNNNSLYPPKYAASPNGEFDSTATFEFWENLCYEMSPNKRAKSQLSKVDSSGIPSHDDLIRKSDEQMASLDDSIVVEEKWNSDNKNSNKTAKDNLSESFAKENDDNSNHEHPVDSKQGKTCNKFGHILTARFIEKRRKCFEEARKVFEKRENVDKNKNRKPLKKNKSLEDCDNEAGFVNTLSACVDYFDHFKHLQHQKNALQCILECSEDSESTKESGNDTRPIQYVEAVILPAQNRAKFRIESPEYLRPTPSPRTKNLIAETCIYVPGCPATPNQRSLAKSPKGLSSRLSPSHRLSPGARSTTVIAKKIKSPTSSARKMNMRGVKSTPNESGRQTPSKISGYDISGDKQNTLKTSASRCPSGNKLKSRENNSPGLMDVTNIKKRFETPKITLMSASPSSESQPGSCCSKKQLHFSESITPEVKQEKPKKYFYTPESKQRVKKVVPKKKYFETPKGKSLQNRLPSPIAGSYRINFNTVQSPVGMYIRGTDPNLIKNVKGKTNERMLTPRAKSPRSKSQSKASPILSRSPCFSSKSTETSRLKFQLTPSKEQMQNQAPDILNIALCESDHSSDIGSENTSKSPFPKIFYKPAQCVKMVKDDQLRRHYPKALTPGMEEKIIYRHEGRLKAAAETKVSNLLTANENTKDNNSSSYDSGEISLLHQRPAMKSNYLMKK